MSHSIESSTASLDNQSSRELLGTIVRLQVQTACLKRGEKPRRWYDPAPIRAVPTLRLDDGGVTGVDGALIPDVHHRDHPQSGWRGDNGVSVGLTGHYEKMRERFGDHIEDGISGENILIDAQRTLTDADFQHGVAIMTETGTAQITAVLGAPPCVEFSKYAAGYSRDQKPDRFITESLQFLSNGTRGFYATLLAGESTPVDIAIGNEVYLIRR